MPWKARSFLPRSHSSSWCEHPHSTIAEIFQCDLVHSLRRESSTEKVQRRLFHTRCLPSLEGRMSIDSVISSTPGAASMAPTPPHMHRSAHRKSLGERRRGPDWTLEGVKIVNTYTTTRRNKEDAVIVVRKNSQQRSSA